MSFELNVHSVDSESKKVCGITRLSFCSPLGAHEILPSHEPLVTELVPCKVAFSSETGATEEISLDGGLLIFRGACCDVWAF
jgi:F0F1-type ATP synthase epsilon subunit